MGGSKKIKSGVGLLLNRKYGRIWEIGMGMIMAALLLILPLLIFLSITPRTEEFDKAFFWFLVGYPALGVVFVLISQIVTKLKPIPFSEMFIAEKEPEDLLKINRSLWTVGITMLTLWFTSFLIFLFSG